MKEPYICPHCDQRSTRWWNLEIHMKRKHGKYSLGRSSGQYMPDNPFWYKRNNQSHNFGPTTVTDTVGIGVAVGILATDVHVQDNWQPHLRTR